MKFQCTVCGQMIEQNDCCPICGSDSSKIIELGDESSAASYRCLSCGRIFENKDMCPYCGGEELFDLTHDCMFNRNEKKEKEETNKVEEESIDLFSQKYEESEINPIQEEDKFDDVPVDVSKYEEKVEEVKEEEVDNSTLISDDENNTEITIEEENEPVLETKEENSESIENDENPFLSEEDVKVEENEDKIEEVKFEETKKEESNVLTQNNISLSSKRSLGQISLLYSLIIAKDNVSTPLEVKKELNILIDELKLELKKENSLLLTDDLIEAFNNLIKIDEEVFNENKTPYNGYILYKDSETLEKIKEFFKK